MALASFTTLKAPSGSGYQGSVTATLASAKTDTGATDHVDTAGYASKLVVAFLNGSGETAGGYLEGSHDASTWTSMGFTTFGDKSGGDARDATPVIAETLAAASGLLFFAAIPGEWPRYVRFNVSNGNSAGVTVTAYLER